MVKFEGYDRRIDKINVCLAEYGIASLEEAKEICTAKGIDVEGIVKGVQPIAFENAVWAYTLGAAIALKKGITTAAEAAEAIGIGLQAFCIPGSVAENRKVGLGHGNLAAMLLREETKCFCFLAGHESFAAAEGAIGIGLQAFCIPGSVAENRQVGLGHGNLGSMLLSEETECFCFLAGHESFAAAEGAIKIALNANKVRNKPLRVILNGLGKDAAMIISRINGFTYVQTEFDPYTEEVKVVMEKAYSDGDRAKVKCYGADSVPEGVAIMKLEKVGVSITGNST
ncbi:MAG: GGGtGRT protein, partial [Clostridia bacterium]|nr:GGGtGRT protein [Clostridia bacterium]